MFCAKHTYGLWGVTTVGLDSPQSGNVIYRIIRPMELIPVWLVFKMAWISDVNSFYTEIEPGLIELKGKVDGWRQRCLWLRKKEE